MQCKGYYKNHHNMYIGWLYSNHYTAYATITIVLYMYCDGCTMLWQWHVKEKSLLHYMDSEHPTCVPVSFIYYFSLQKLDERLPIVTHLRYESEGIALWWINFVLCHVVDDSGSFLGKKYLVKHITTEKFWHCFYFEGKTVKDIQGSTHRFQ